MLCGAAVTASGGRPRARLAIARAAGVPGVDTKKLSEIGEDVSNLEMRCYELKEFGSPLVETARFIPVPTTTELVVSVKGAGLCHSDVHICDGYFDLGGGKKAPLAGVDLPLIPGHEIAGEVLAVGPDVVGVKAGDVVLVDPWIGCGQCETCAAGDDHLCNKPRFMGLNSDGGFTDCVLVPHERYVIDLQGLDPVAMAPYACSGLTAFGAIKKLRSVMQSQPIVIIGAGGLGLMALHILSMLGARGAVVVELDERRRQAALDAGALAVFDPAEPKVGRAIKDFLSAQVPGVIDFVGSEQTTTLGFNLLGRGGKLVIVGLFGGSATFPIAMFPSRGVSIEGSYIGSHADLEELIELARGREGGPPPLAVDPRPMNSANDAILDLRNGNVVGRVVLVP